MTVEEALAYLKPDAASNGTISLRASKARRAVEIIAAEIAANQSRAFEDGARWMREGAAETAKHRYSPLNTERFIANGETVRNRHGHELFATIEEIERHVSERVAAIQALPLQPEGERSDA